LSGLCNKIFALFWVTFAFSQAAAYAFNPNLVEGARLYYAGKYEPAYKALYIALKQDPNDAESHELMGLVLEKYKRFDSALQELTTAVRLDPEGDIGRMARREAAFVRAAASPAAAPTPVVPQSNAQYAQARVWLASSQVQGVARALDTIDSQAQSEREARLHYKSDIADYYERSSAQTTSALQKEKANAVKNMQSMMMTDIKGNQVPIYSGAEIAKVRNDYDERISLATISQREALEQAQNKENDALSGVEQTVDGLRSQFATTSGAKGNLLPGGTNLFVRNYAAGTEASKPPEKAEKDQAELQADQYKLVLDKVPHGAKPAARVVRDPLNVSGSPNDARLRVNGRMLPVGTEQP
jgi:tetratricopeptide (TPR) repeat protein